MHIIFFGPGRTGSTLVYNILKDLGFSIVKQHQLLSHTKPDKTHKFISCIRDLRDVLASRARIYKIKYSDKTIHSIITQMKRIGLDDLIKFVEQKKPILVLKYELFWNNYDYIFDELERFLDITIDKNKREMIKNKRNVDAMKKIASNFKSFKQYDIHTNIHGDHISQNNGAPGSWIKNIPVEYHDLVSKELKYPLELFEYLP